MYLVTWTDPNIGKQIPMCDSENGKACFRDWNKAVDVAQSHADQYPKDTVEIFTMKTHVEPTRIEPKTKRAVVELQAAIRDAITNLGYEDNQFSASSDGMTFHVGGSADIFITLSKGA